MSRSAQQILRLGNAFCEAQALLTAVELDLFSALHHAPATEEEVRLRLGLHPRGLRDFLALLVELQLLERHDGRYRNSANADRHLVRGGRDYVGGFLLGAKTNLYPLWSGLTETLRTGRPQSTGDNFDQMLDDPAALRRYARMMDGVLQPLIPHLLAAIDWSRYREVVDVGGCRGSLVAELALAHPALVGRVFDLPPLAPVCAEYLAERSLTGRVTFQPGDFFRDPLPEADVMILGHVLHNWSPAQRGRLLGKAFHGLRPGGLLLVHDRMLDDARPSLNNLVTSLVMTLVTEEGSEYPISELAQLATSAGFGPVTWQALDEEETLVVCQKPTPAAVGAAGAFAGGG